MRREFFSEVIEMDKVNASLLGIGLLIASRLTQNVSHINNENSEGVKRVEEGEMEFIKPGLALSEFQSNRYKIEFKFPKGWTKNPRYEDKYEGENGFFEVGDFSGVGENIDEAVNTQINEFYKPYGNSPTIRKFVVDGQPARVIYPSSDQLEYYKDREAALVLKYPEPVIIDGKTFDYVVIWASKAYIPLIISTLRFIKE